METNTTRRVVTLSEHRQLLNYVFTTAKKRVFIVSPFISNSALKADSVCEEVAKAAARGVTTVIYTDVALNKESDGFFKRSAAEGIAALGAAGATVILVKGVHNKTLIMDDSFIAEGSFNWLSAVRIAGALSQRQERTLVVESADAKDMIEREITSIGRMPVVANANDIILALSTVDSGEVVKKVKHETYLSFYLIFGLFGSAAFFAVVGTPLCVVLFLAGLFSLGYRIKQVCENFDYNGPTGSYSSKNTDEPLSHHEMYTLNGTSTSITSSVNFSPNKELFIDDPFKDDVFKFDPFDDPFK